MASARITVRGLEDERDFRALSPILVESLLFDPATVPNFYPDAGHDSFRFAVVDGRVVGGYALYSMGHRFGGRTVPAGGVAGVAVSPEHRASGVGRALMRDALAESARRGLAVSTLFPATVPVYRRAGYEVAGTHTQYRLLPSAIDLRDASPAVRRLTDDDRPAIEACEARRSAGANGPIVRSPWLWKRLLHHPTRTVYRYGIDGARKGSLDAYVIYVQAAVGGTNHYDVVVRDWAATTPVSARRLLSFLATHRSLASAVLITGAPAEPLLLHLRETPTAVESHRVWMLRVVDVKAALEARGYSAGLSSRVTIDVADDGVPANAGRWTLDVDGGRARVRRGGRAGVRIDVRGLACLFTSQHMAAELVRVGLVAGSDRDLAALSAIFSGPAPWMVEGF